MTATGPHESHATRRAMAVAALLSLLLGLGVLIGSPPAQAQSPACTKAWSSAADGFWDDAARWSPAGVPSSADDVCITLPGAYVVTLHGARSAKSVQIGASSGTNKPELRVLAIGNLGGGPPVADARLTVTNNIEVTPLGVLTLSRNGIQVSDAYVDGSPTSVLINSGTVSSVFGNGAGGRTIGLSLTNNAGGTVNISQPTVFNGPTFTNNGGTVALTQPLDVTRFANFVNSAGAINATGTGQLQKTGAGSPANTNGTFTQGNGTTTGNPVEVRDANLNITGTGATSFALHGANVLSGTVASTQTLNLETVRNGANSTTTLTAPVTNNGTITLTRYDPGAGGGADTTTITSATPSSTPLTNNGTITASGCCFNTIRTNLNNQAAGVVNINGYSRVDGTATFTNSGGTVALTQPLEVTRFANFVNSAGAINATGTGQLQKTGAGSPANSNGTFTQGNGTTTGNPVEVRDANLNITGTGAASFALHGANVLSGTVASGQTLNLETVRNGANSTTTLTAPVTNNGTITLTRYDPGAGGSSDSTAITSATPASTPLTNNGTITASGCCFNTIQTNLNNNAAGTVNINRATTVTASTLTNGGLVSVAANVQLTVAAGATFTQTAGGTFRSNIDAGAPGSLAAGGNVNLAGTIAANTTSTPALGTTFTVLTFPSRTGTFTATSFTGGTNYQVNQNATNVQLVVVAPASVPGPPTGATATAGNGQATVTFAAPTNNGGSAINGYVVTPFIGATPQTAQTFNSTATTQVVTGLANGTSYTFKVAARNAVGTGPQSAASNAVSPVSNQSFVKAAYADFLHRQPTPGELALQTASLDNGNQSRGQLVNALSSAPEYVSALVQKLYQDTLGRPGEAGGVNYWTDEIRSGRRTVALVAANFYASPEYFNGIGGGNNRSWVTDLYRKLLLRDPENSGAVDYWEREAITKGRVDVAFRFFQTQESRETRVKNLYQALLGRGPDAGGLAYWAGRVGAEGDLALAANLAASPEYFGRAQTRFP